MDLNDTLLGAIATASLIAGLFFFRFWRQSHDRFFLYFALSFWIEAAQRAALAVMTITDETEPVVYGVRVVAYGLIVVAILQKNRRR